MTTVITATIILCICGLVAGAALAIASRVFAVETDPRIDKIESILPGANCSGCGNPSCYAYAAAMVEENASPNQCVLVGEKEIQEIGSILGQEVGALEKRVAAIRCYGGERSQKKFIYDGMPSCRVLSRFSDGDSACRFSCLGFGDCVKACPFDALSRDGRNTPHVDPARCTGCGQCVSECPKDVIILVPANARPHIACSTTEPGKAVRQSCPIGCISCRKCIKTCPEKAIDITNNLIVIDYSKCTSCGQCIDACPRNIIFDLGAQPASGAATQ
ncbi:MAG: Fe-S cluster domain-containing protein [Deltaproteobacteria bacterium]|nr:Fe-S cluster domain-containing protein [Deltaproteobacteria bacterium]